MPDLLVQPIWEVSPFSIAIVEYDRAPKNRKIVYVNPAFVKLTGYSNEEAVGKPVALLDGPGMDQSHVTECETALDQGAPFTRQIRHCRKDGSNYLCQVTIAPLIEPSGPAEFLILVETEVTVAERGGALNDGRRTSLLVPLTLPMPLIESSSVQLPSHLPSHPELNVLHDLWSSMSENGEPPRRSKFNLDNTKRWASRLSIATVVSNGRFQFRLFGTDLARVYGRDLTGCYLDELSPSSLWSVVILHYQTVVETRQPLFAPISISNGRWYSEVSRLIMPLSSDDQTVAFIMGADYSRTTI
jgi:PAS domain S-box-containing protein